MNPVEPQSERTAPAVDDPRVVAALEQYLSAIEAGTRPNRSAFLARHADIAEPLAECLDGVEALHAQSSAEGPASVPGGTESPEWRPGTPLGDFRIIRELGRGGMGVVYEAEQLSLGRRIALKVLPFALTLDPRQLQRFKNEARAAAQLHHQNIVPIYFVGCERAVHFYAMQYIEGQSLAEVIQGLRRVSGLEGVARPERAWETASTPFQRVPPEATTGPYAQPAPAATPDTVSDSASALATSYSSDGPRFFRTAAQLGVQAAEALEHAHQYGVVHRDIKPGNLLVDTQGNLWVADFGLAQFQSDSALTMTGDLLGTLRYMSPEQALAQRGVVDHRADIYSLGATLYELLTLAPAYGGRDRHELLRQIAFDEPRPPRRLNPAIPADLETIILKAMAKAVEERYATARELADDLRCFLEHKPIRARRPTLLERGSKWVRRHQALVGMAVLLLAVTVVALAASTILIFREQEKTRLAYEGERIKAREADEQRTQAEESFRQARAAVDFFTQLIENDAPARPGPFQGPHQELRRKALAQALAYYESFLAQRRDDPTLQAELEASQARVARLLSELATLQGLGHLMLLREPLVLNDLKVPEERRKPFQELTRNFDDQQRRLFGPMSTLTAEQRQRAYVDLAVAHEREVSSLLSPEQSRRLRQIDFQVRGPLAFADPEVVKALALTPEQQEKIRELQAKSSGGFREFPPMPKGTPPFRDGRRDHEPPGRREHDFGRRQIVEEIVKLLSPEQQARWKELTGDPCPVPMRPPVFGGGFRPGGV